MLQRTVVVLLAASLAVTQVMWLRAERKASYYEGRDSFYRELVIDPNAIGVCYAADGCPEMHTTKRK